MRTSRYSEEQIILALKHHEAGRTTAEICRKPGVSEQTFNRWKVKCGGMKVADAKKLKSLEDYSVPLWGWTGNKEPNG